MGLSTVVVWLPLMAIATAALAYLENKYDSSLDALAAYLYVRQELETPVSFAEAKALSFLFRGNTLGKWYPMIETRKLPKEERKQYLFDFAARVRQN